MEPTQQPLFPELAVTAEEGEAFSNIMEKQVGGSHYKCGGDNMQPWDIALAWDLNGWEMSVLKYLLRHRYKNGIEDIEKLIHCAEFIKENYEELYALK
jgi:hypothetical protein